SFVSQAPAASATSVPRTSTVALVFGRALDPASVTVGSAAQCTGSIQLATSSTFTDGTCVGVTKAVSAGDTTVTLTPAQALAGGTGYWVRTTTALHDVDGLPLPTQYVSPHAFTTAAALAVASFAPAGTSVPRNTQVSVTFTAPPSASTVSTNTSGTACSGSFQLSKDAFATCVTMKAAPGASNGGLTFSMSPAADLDGSTAYTLRVTTDVQDGDGLALSAAATSTPFATSTTVDSTPPGEITGLVTTTTLRSAAFSWTNPGDSDLHGVRVYRRPHGSGAFTLLATIGTDSGGHSATDDGLPGLTSFDYKFTTVDLAGNESSGLIATAVFTGFTGSGADFNDAQRVSMGAATGDAPKLAIGWNADSLYLGISDSTGAGSALGATDTLWIAIDTDPDTDTNGEVRTPTVGVNDILWPFKADLVFKLVPNQLETHVDMHDASTSTFSLASGAIGFDGAVDEVAIPRSLLDSATRVRIAVAAVNDTNGYVFADAPAGRGTDTFAFFASLTSGLDTGTKLFDATAGLAGPANLTTFDAPALITLAVDRGQASDGAVFVQGDQHPLSFTDGVSIHTLTRAGTSTVYSGRFNFGGALGELLFKFRESANGSTNTEPLFSAIGVDRVFELEGGGQVAPTVAWGQSYSASHPFDIAFILCSGGTPTQLRGNVSELGNFSTSNATFVATSACADASNGWVTDVNFAAPNGTGHDFTATPLQFKAYYSDDTFEGGSDHAMNDDILNRRVITWHAGDGSTF
ncbi:MAG: Ig-like domain-containing protein, partial [Deltaproteobacteria bacterium]|nr:Ig-like domain-containing protein [Deltaproteobacteria bacterium]